ncbi:hypothetical protein K5M33_04030 [Chromobacterium vaccinii]|nr:hypothetical protein [Chromobacterium vaccinii]MBX9355874.1 hypothetical protein [Chromobacterium vaccinii]
MDSETWGVIFKQLIIPVISLILLPWITSRFKTQNITLRKDKRVIRLDFINAYLAFDIEKRHPVSVELAFEVFFGRQIPYEEIEHILKLKNPTLFVKLLKDASDFIKFDSTLGQYTYQKGFETTKQRKRGRAIRFIWYAAFIYIAMLLVGNSSTLLIGAGPSVVAVYIFLILLFFTASFAMLKDAPKVIRAEKAMQESIKFKKQ